MTDMAHFNLNNIPGILEQAYVYIIQNAQDTYREFFRIVSEERNTPLLFHCSAGKDRTGIAAALLLGALGVDREVIMEDYMLSAEYIKGKYDAIVQAHPDLPLSPQYGKNIWKLLSKPLTLTIKVWITT